MHINFVLLSESETGGTEETDESLPGKFEVCPRCEGHGTHLTPSIGEHAYSAEEFNESFSDEEDRAEYFKRGGIYDVQCYECKGEKVVLVVDEDACRTDEEKALLEMYYHQCEEQARDAAEDRAMRRAEDGGYGWD